MYNLNLEKTDYVILIHWMGQKMVIVVTDWSEEDEWDEVGEEVEGRLSHCS